jgi:hypothetical protein
MRPPFAAANPLPLPQCGIVVPAPRGRVAELASLACFTRMKTIRIFWLALAAGAVMEAALCGVFAMFGRLGPCGPGNDVTGVVLLIHLPAIRVAESILPQSSVFLPMVVVVTAALFSIGAFVVISAIRTFYARPKTPPA